MSDDDDLQRFAARNKEFLGEVIAYGDTEARAYALAIVKNSASVEDIEEIQAQVDEIRRQLI